MKVLEVMPGNIDRRKLEEAVDALRRGEVIIYPTDTRYALGCDALNNRAIEAVCRLKGVNPARETLSVVCADIRQAAEYARIDNRAFALLKEHTPGPFTFILPAATTLPKVFKGRRTVGLRIPDNDIARTLASELGHPLLSATASTDPFVAGAEVAMEWEGRASLALDGGESAADGSTVVLLTDSSEPEIIREGLGKL